LTARCHGYIIGDKSDDGQHTSLRKVAPLKFYHAYLARAIFVVDFKVNGQEVTNFLTVLK